MKNTTYCFTGVRIRHRVTPKKKRLRTEIKKRNRKQMKMRKNWPNDQRTTCPELWVLYHPSIMIYMD